MFTRRMFSFALVATLALGALAISQEKKPGDDKMPAGMDAAAMKAMQDAGTPGPQHKALEAMTGEFNYVSNFKMDPSQDWMKSEGKYQGEMQLGGRYLFFSVSGPMMGMTFEGRGAFGYDNVIGKYVMAWVDNMGTGILRAEGTSDDDGKTLTFAGEMMDPMTKKNTPFKQEFKVTGPDTFTMRWWSPSMTDGKMFESMNIEYTRAK